MSDKDRIPAEVFILFKLEGLKTALSDSPLCFLSRYHFKYHNHVNNLLSTIITESLIIGLFLFTLISLIQRIDFFFLCFCQMLQQFLQGTAWP